MTRKPVADLLATMQAELTNLGFRDQKGLAVRPSLIAQQICSVQPMTGPSPMIWSMRTNYGGPWGCDGNCVDDAWGMFHETIVDFPGDHAVIKKFNDPIQWAIENCKSPFNFSTVHLACDMNRKFGINVWRWSFADQDEAFQFKVRWM